MKAKNLLSAKVTLVNGNVIDILQLSQPKQVIDNWLFPDSGVPVSSIKINLLDENGIEHAFIITTESFIVKTSDSV